ncbi:FecR domain-containing protein [Bowmanella sp. Y26]|uniref:FecR family protein n=1 Tax=Bowmanella yangjiangensis TaxID=2811230 RepID=UPI001BDD93F6|nr:FecR domain-containing protein [Bowmanella yangjiangensis]MBT1063327.1 FecR domain-containing protein [Bowmanella yangjiangensis]
MSKVIQYHKPEDLLEQASLWLAKLDRGLNRAEQRAFVEFMQHPQARATLEELAQLWDKMDVLAKLVDLMPPTAMAKPSRHFSWQVSLSMAAALLLAVSALFLFPVHQSLPVATAQQTIQLYQTEVGEYRRIVLLDGTQVSLNSDSRLRVSFTAKVRQIYLERGEAFFEVAHEPERPFNVWANDRVFQAVGTAFSVQIDKQKVALIVQEGIVSVNKADEDTALLAETLLPDGQLMQAGTRGEYLPLQDSTAPIVAKELEKRLSWRQGNIIFTGDRLEDAIAEVSRHTRVQFEFIDEQARNVQVAGRFKLGDVDGLLVALQDNFNIHYQRIGDDRILLSARSW